MHLFPTTNVKASFEVFQLTIILAGATNPYTGGRSSLDFNGDGDPDRPFIDSKNESIVILSGGDKQKWVVPLQYNYYKVEILKGRIAGFYEMDGDTATTEIVIVKQEGNHFCSPIILSLDKSSPKLAEADNLLATPNYILLGIKDVDNDGKDDIVVADTTRKMIEILSY